MMSSPQTSDSHFFGKLSRVLEKSIDKEGWHFGCTVGGEVAELSSSEMTAPDAFLPALLHRAQQLMEDALGKTSLISYRLNEGAYCCVVPESPGDASLATWLLFSHYALEECVKNAPQKSTTPERVPALIDGWVNSWEEALEANTLLLLPRLPSPAQSFNS